MTLDTITMDPAAARIAYREYQAAVRADRTAARAHWKAEDVALAQGYKQLAKGKALLDVRAALRTAGLRTDGYPKLAIARSDLDKVFCSMGLDGNVEFHSAAPRRGLGRRQAERIAFPAGTFPSRASYLETRGTLVPIIPPALRPKFKLEGYHTLWEVESWTLEPPRDPLLLRHLGGDLYVVVAVWDLTDLERAVLGGRATTV